MQTSSSIPVPGRSRKRSIGVSAVAAAVFAGSMVAGVAADGAVVTRGEVHAFAGGVGMPISGRAQMVRSPDGKTFVSLHVEGLLASTPYGAHVHKQACADGDADGHFRFDPSGPAAPPNEIWPGFTTNAAGVGNGNATVDGMAGPTAVSVVIHAPGGAKIACADLE